MRIAMIGGGVSGLTAAYRLHKSHDITLFEAADYAGGHVNTVDVEVGGERRAIDTGFIVFNDWTYPRFIGLLDELGVASQPTTMSFSVSDPASGLEYNGHSLNTLFAQRRNLIRPSFYRMLRDILRFNREALSLSSRELETTTVGEFLASRRYGATFKQHYLLPMGAAIWSCPLGSFENFPIRFVAEFYRNHGLLNLRNRPTWRVIAGGSRGYVEAMIAGFRDRIRLRTPVVQVRRDAHGVEVRTSHGEAASFEHVVFACHSDQALRILGSDATPQERSVLGAFPYSRNTATLHTDVGLLPRSRRAWAAWNYRTGGDRNAPASVTYNMNLLQGFHSPHTYCVTLNDDGAISPRHILRQFVYHHPVFTVERSAAQAQRADFLARNRTSYCGAYWRNGFHEDGVVSACEVVAAIKRLGDATPRHSHTAAATCAVEAAP